MINVRWLEGIFRRRPPLPPAAASRLDAWHKLPRAAFKAPHPEAEFVVADTETTGLNVFADRLVAIGAVRVARGRIQLGSAFYRVLRQPAASTKDNILIHGITGTQQRAGDDPVEVLLAFAEYAGRTPLVGWNSGFDELMIAKATNEYFRRKWKLDWLDLAWLAPALHPDTAAKRIGLDHYLDKHGIAVLSRHHALADALATAQLLLVFQKKASAQGLRSVGELIEAAASARYERGRTP